MNNQHGSVIIWVTLMITLLLAMVGMGLDTGQMTYTRNQGQVAVDAAALAAISGLPSRNESLVRGRAILFNNTNDFTGSKTTQIQQANVTLMQYDFSTGTMTATADINAANAVRVALESQNPYDAAATNTPITTPVFLTPLMRLLGIPSSAASATQNVSVSAVATITSKPAIPIAIWAGLCGTDPSYPIQHDVKIQMQHPDQKADGNEDACWTTYFDCSSGAPDIKAGFTTADECTGNSINGSIAIDSLICQNRGQVNTVMKTAEDFFFTDNPNLWWTVPVIAGGGNCDPTNPTKIVDFARIKPTAIVTTANPKYITADVQCHQPLTDLSASKCFSHRLVRDTKSGM
jgi:Flp pilus assembly protein TadG